MSKMHKNIIFTMFLQGLLQILLCNKDWSWTTHWTPLDWTNGPVLISYSPVWSPVFCSLLDWTFKLLSQLTLAGLNLQMERPHREWWGLEKTRMVTSPVMILISKLKQQWIFSLNIFLTLFIPSFMTMHPAIKSIQRAHYMLTVCQNLHQNLDQTGASKSQITM